LPDLADLRWSRVEFWLRQALREIEFRDLAVLDIGAGDGIFSCYMALQGAARVVSLEPELDGSTSQAHAVLARRVGELSLDTVHHESATFQEFTGASGSFDVILAHNVVNHLDEEAVVVLHRGGQARSRYRELIAKMYRLLRPDGTLVLADCARANLFPHLGLRNPIARSIEWHKHQNPQVWIDLLTEVGFKRIQLHWTYPRRLRAFGALLDNRVAAYLGYSHFVIHADRGAGAQCGRQAGPESA
jgi:SAM-dependent methyltransferase